ncbi:hypothetical protein [Streptomyces sp. NPDC086182]|uniref:hypothetical protein n=1 Tax=Streptomyces sp. NPDC086182 TaxID=3155058 RepID=UPI0034221C55
MTHQTCKRHPEAGRFLRECYGCKRDLFDLQARNESEANRRQAARTALANIGIDQTVRILSAIQIGPALIVAAEQPDGYFRYTVDAFRQPTPDETDPEQTDPRLPGEWILIDQCGDHGADDLDRMIRDVLTRLDELGVTADESTDTLLAALHA